MKLLVDRCAGPTLADWLRAQGQAGVEPGTESAQQTGLPPWLPATAAREPWNVWRTRGADLEGMREWTRKQTATASA